MEHRTVEKPFTYLLVKRASFFLFLVSVFSTLFWVAGNWSRFLDETQLMLIGFVRWSSIALVLVSGIGAFLSMFRAWKRGIGARLMAFLGYLLLAALGLAFMLLSQFIATVAAGA